MKMKIKHFFISLFFPFSWWLVRFSLTCLPCLHVTAPQIHLHASLLGAAEHDLAFWRLTVFVCLLCRVYPDPPARRERTETSEPWWDFKVLQSFPLFADLFPHSSHVPEDVLGDCVDHFEELFSASSVREKNRQRSPMARDIRATVVVWNADGSSKVISVASMVARGVNSSFPWQGPPGPPGPRGPQGSSGASVSFHPLFHFFHTSEV